MLGSYQVFFLKVFIISCLIFEITSLARVENWSQNRRPNNTGPSNQWHSNSNAVTARNPYLQPHATNQWNPYNQTAGLNNNYNSNNNWQHNTYNQHPGQTHSQQPPVWGGGGGGAAAQRPQAINPWLRNNQTHNNNPQNPYVWNAARPNTTHAATTPASHNSGWGGASSAGQNNWGNTPQQYPGAARPTSPPTSGWGAVRPNATHQYAPSTTNTNNNMNWGQSTGADQNKWNVPQQYPGPGGVDPQNHTTGGWHTNSGSGGGNTNQPGAEAYSPQPQPQQPQNPTIGSGWHSSSTSTGSAFPGLAPLKPIGGGGAGTGNPNPWDNNNGNTQTGGGSSSAGAAPLTPVGGAWNTGGLNNPWNSGNTQSNTGSSSGTPLAPLGGGSGASTWNGANGGQAGLSYGQHQPGQTDGAGGNHNPYANLFN